MNFECPQFVPQEVCLSCEGCCRFKEEATIWRPKFSADEVYALRRQGHSLAQRIFSASTIDEETFVRTKTKKGCFQCNFFEDTSNACSIYAFRPFECRLYPFILNRAGKKISLCVHLACPHIQDHLDAPQYTDFIGKLKQYFSSREVKQWVQENFSSINDYSAYANELQALFEIPVGPDNAISALLNNRLLFERASFNQSQEISAQAFSSIFLWQDFFEFKIEKIEGSVCIFAHMQGRCFLYFPPFAKNLTPSLIDACFAHMDRYNKNKELSQVEHLPQSQLQYFPENKFIHYNKGNEYCYTKLDIIDLKGNAFKSKRHDLNHFLKHQNPQFLPYDVSMAGECLKLFDFWAHARRQKSVDAVYLQMLEDNRQVHALALQYFEQIGLTGRVVKINNEIKGYTFGYPLNKETFCILFEVADLSITGLPVYIFNQFCADFELQEYTTINTMDDFGMDNIKETKMSFHPALLIPTYSVKRCMA